MAGPESSKFVFIAGLVAEAVRQTTGVPGVLIRDVPYLSPDQLLPLFVELIDRGMDLRIAYLSDSANGTAASLGLTADVFSARVEDAEKWRNQPGLDALIVVVAEADVARLTSLEEFFPIGPSRLRQLIVQTAVAKFGEVNDVLPRWWGIVGDDDHFSLLDLLDYYLVLEGVDPPSLNVEAPRHLDRLGLLPDAGFFDGPSERQLRDRLADNRNLAQRLANFSEEDRKRVESALKEIDDASRRLELKSRLRALQGHRRGADLTLSADDARDLLNIRRRPSRSRPDGDPSGEPSQRKPPIDLTLLGVESLLEPEGDDREYSEELVEKVISDLGAQLKELTTENAVRPTPVSVALPSGAQIDHEVKTDLLSLMQHAVSPERLGGTANAIGRDVPQMVRSFQQATDFRDVWETSDLRALAEIFASDSPAFSGIGEALSQYLDARSALVEYLPHLATAPMLLASSPAALQKIAAAVDAYQVLIATTERLYGELHQSFADDALAFVELLLLADTVFLESPDAFVALLSPLNPLLLWHYVEFATAIRQQNGTLSAADQELLRSEFEKANGVPLFVSAIGVPRRAAPHGARSLPFSGRIGVVPHFSVDRASVDHRDGIDAVMRTCEAFVSLYPAAREGLRLALLDPPDTGTILGRLCDLAEAGHLHGAHVTILRRGDSSRAELDLSSDEERRISQRFGDHTRRRFTLTTRRIGEHEYGLERFGEAHVLVAFDQTPGTPAEAGGLPQAVQPLANRRRLVYRHSAKTLDLAPALGGILDDYGRFAKLAITSGVNSYQTKHQAQSLRDALTSAATSSAWFVLADSHVDRDLEIGAARVLTTRERSRDIVTFAGSLDPFRRALRDVVRQFNTAVSDDQLDALLMSLSRLLDAGLLSLKPGRSGDTIQSHVRGVLGLLVAVHALEAAAPEGARRLVLSLDDVQAQRWLHLAEDPHRADLLVIDGRDDSFTVTIAEVKTVGAAAGEFTLRNGEVHGPAVEQLASTYRILRQVFDRSGTDQILAPSRREILREHVYRELSKGSYGEDYKKLWARLSEQLFDRNTEVDLRGELIHVQLGVAATSLDIAHEATAYSNGQPFHVTIRHLNEEGDAPLALALRQPDPTDASAAPEAREHVAGPIADDGPTSEAPASDVDAASGGAGVGPLLSQPTATTSTEEDDTDRPRVRVMVGVAQHMGGSSKEIWYDPQHPTHALNNPHISISGETGSGKTQATKAILRGLRTQGIPALILDFKDDYSRPDYADAEGLAVHDASFGSLPFNPLVPPIDPVSGRANPIGHIHELANMLQRIYRLGDQQTFQLREAIKEAFSSTGVPTTPFEPAIDQTYPAFGAIREILVRDGAGSLLGRLSPIFDLELFSQSHESTLGELLNSSTVIRLSQLPGDQVKNAVAEFFLMALYNFLVRREQPHRLERVLVLDEAWRLVDSPFLEPLMREGRAFGLGIIVATQFPKDLPPSVSGSTATRMYFSQTKAEQVKEILQTFYGKSSGSEPEHLGNLVRALVPLECILQNNQYKPWARVEVRPYFALPDDKSDGDN